MTRTRGQISPDGTRYWDGEGRGWEPLWMTADEAVAAVRDRFGRPARRPEFLAAGYLNQSWRIGDAVLRVSRTERTPEQIR